MTFSLVPTESQHGIHLFTVAIPSWNFNWLSTPICDIFMMIFLLFSFCSHWFTLVLNCTCLFPSYISFAFSHPEWFILSQNLDISFLNYIFWSFINKLKSNYSRSLEDWAKAHPTSGSIYNWNCSWETNSSLEMTAYKDNTALFSFIWRLLVMVKKGHQITEEEMHYSACNWLWSTSCLGLVWILGL